MDTGTPSSHSQQTDDSLWHTNVRRDPKYRQRMFETIVMHALWILIRCAFGSRPYVEASDLRLTMVAYGEAVDEKDTAERREFRKTTTFAPLPLSTGDA